MITKYNNILLLACLCILVIALLLGLNNTVQVFSKHNMANLTQQADKQVLPFLIDEIKLLRLAIERSNSSVPVFQVLLERTRLQHKTVLQISLQLQDAKLEGERARLETEQYLRRVENLKDRRGLNTAAESQVAIDNEINEMNTQAEQQKQRVQLYIQQVDRLDAQLTQEQQKLDSFNLELDKLQAEIRSTVKIK